MKASFSNMTIKAISAIVPHSPIKIRDRCPHLDETMVNRITSSTGIDALRIASNGTRTSDLCEIAALSLMEKMQCSPKDIDVLIFISQTPDQLLPATSVTLQSRLHLQTQCFTADLHYGCSGYIYGLFHACLLLSQVETVLLCVGDVISPYIDSTDHTVASLFSDAASASLITRGYDTCFFVLGSDGKGAPFLKCPMHLPNSTFSPYLSMNGLEVLMFAVREVPLQIHDLLDYAEWEKDEVELLLLHQANTLLIHQIKKQLNFPRAKTPISLKNLGNTGNASIPTLLSSQSSLENLQYRKVIASGFGVGWSWGSVAFSLKETSILPLLEH